MADGKTFQEAADAFFSSDIIVQDILVEDVTPDTLDDFDFLEILATMSDPDAENGEKLRAIANYGPAIFGKTQWRRIKAELREQNDGKLTVEIVMEFINGVMAALSAKNS